MIRNLVLLSFSFIYIINYSCVPPDKDVLSEPKVDWSIAECQEIINAGDQRRVDILESYLTEPDVTKRYLAAQMLSSIPNHEVLEPLYNILISDNSKKCRVKAAFALGQSGQEEAKTFLVNAFAYQDSLEVNDDVRMTILEAVGKVGDYTSLNQIAEQSTYLDSHNKLLLGQARALYQFGLRGMTVDKGHEKMISFLISSDVSNEVKLIGANYFYRFRNIDLSLLDERLLQALKANNDPRIQMCLISAISRSGDVELFPSILKEIQNATDYRVKVNGLKGLSAFPYVIYRDSILKFLNDDNSKISLTAADLVKNNITSTDIRPMIRFCQNELSPQVKAKLYAGILRAVPYFLANTRKRVSDEIQIAMNQSDSAYDKALFIDALSYDPINYEIIYQKGVKSSTLPVITQAVNSMANILSSEKFDRIYRTPQVVSKVRADILKYLLETFETNNSGAIAAASELLRMEELNFKDEIQSLEPLMAASRALVMPEQLEAKISIEKTIAYLNDEKYSEVKASYNQPISWNILNTMTDSSVVYVLTDKGNIELELYHKEAPGSVANFVSLIELDFYDGKVFHRVVPNFVIQTGCPRGDGYGSLNYTIRSEFSDIHYDQAGYIGMASAGPDTESTQWFITHSPTPHLDGKYTIFGKVKKGMDVVHAIEQGDQIKDIRIVKN